MVAIPSVFGYNILLGNVKTMITELENYASNLADRIELWLDGLDLLDDADLATISAEVLAVRIERHAGEGEGSSLELDEHPSASAWLAKAP